LPAEEVLKAEFEVAHRQYALDGTFAQFAGEGQDIRGDPPKLLVLLGVFSWSEPSPQA
jgi:hypothetical protein